METPFELGKQYEFFGVDNNLFKLGDQVFEALEDECDGHRSYLGSVVTTQGGVFFPNPVDTVVVLDDTEGDEDTGGDFEGYKVVGKDGHVWLRFGTRDYSDYYPCFRFVYHPRAK